MRGIGDPSKFFLTVTESPFPEVIYFRVLGKNEAGYGIGPVKKIKIPEPPQLWWGEIQENMGGWKSFIGLATLYTMKRVGSFMHN